MSAPGAKVWHDEMKAEPLTTAQMDRWLQGKRARRVLVVPFTGPLPGGKAGLDLDGEYFDGETDLIGRFPYLARTRDRLVDWHHGNDPTGRMKGAILGRVVMDEQPEDDGHWADFWANAGEQRRELIARLESAGIPLYGSSQAIPSGVRKASDGHITVWPLIRHTITTSPQNTHAVMPALKGLLTDPTIVYDAASVAALRVAVADDETGTLSTLSTLPLAGERTGERSGERAGSRSDGLSTDEAAMLAEAFQELVRAL